MAQDTATSDSHQVFLLITESNQPTPVQINKEGQPKLLEMNDPILARSSPSLENGVQFYNEFGEVEDGVMVTDYHFVLDEGNQPVMIPPGSILQGRFKIADKEQNSPNNDIIQIDKPKKVASQEIEVPGSVTLPQDEGLQDLQGSNNILNEIYAQQEDIELEEEIVSNSEPVQTSFTPNQKKDQTIKVFTGFMITEDKSVPTRNSGRGRRRRKMPTVSDTASSGLNSLSHNLSEMSSKKKEILNESSSNKILCSNQIDKLVEIVEAELLATENQQCIESSSMSSPSPGEASRKDQSKIRKFEGKITFKSLTSSNKHCRGVKSHSRVNVSTDLNSTEHQETNSDIKEDSSLLANAPSAPSFNVSNLVADKKEDEMFIKKLVREILEQSIENIFKESSKESLDVVDPKDFEGSGMCDIFNSTIITEDIKDNQARHSAGVQLSNNEVCPNVCLEEENKSTNNISDSEAKQSNVSFYNISTHSPTVGHFEADTFHLHDNNCRDPNQSQSVFKVPLEILEEGDDHLNENSNLQDLGCEVELNNYISHSSERVSSLSCSSVSSKSELNFPSTTKRKRIEEDDLSSDVKRIKLLTKANSIATGESFLCITPEVSTSENGRLVNETSLCNQSTQVYSPSVKIIKVRHDWTKKNRGDDTSARGNESHTLREKRLDALESKLRAIEREQEMRKSEIIRREKMLEAEKMRFDVEMDRERALIVKAKEELEERRKNFGRDMPNSKNDGTKRRDSIASINLNEAPVKKRAILMDPMSYLNANDSSDRVPPKKRRSTNNFSNANK